MVAVELIYNLALLAALSVISGFIGQRWKQRRFAEIFQGLLFGGIAVIGMLSPLTFGPGLIFDGRSVVLSLCGLFFGPVSVAIAGAMAIVLRVSQGGVGEIMGIGTILCSALTGIFFYFKYTRRNVELSTLQFWSFGFIVHTFMLLMVFTLPESMAISVFQRIGLPILLIYPLATILIGKIISDNLARNSFMEALRESEERFKNMFEKHNSVMLLIEPESGKIVDSNNAASIFYGYEKTALCSMNINSINILPEKEVAEMRKKALSEKRNYFIFPHKLSNGEVRTVEVHSSPISFHGKDMLFSIIYDITERRKAEESLRESEAKYRFMADNISDVVFIFDLNMKVSYISPSVKQLRGFDPEDFIGQPVSRSVTPASLEYAKKIIQEELELERTGKVDLNRTKALELEMFNKDGTTIWSEVKASFLRDKNNAPVGLLGISRDITERRKAEEALRESEEKFRHLVWDMQVGILLQGPQAEILLSNPKAIELLGVSESQLLGKTSLDPDWNVIHEDGSQFPGHTHPVPQAIASRSSVRNVVMGVYHPFKRDRVWLLVDAIPQLNNDGTVRQVVCSFIDITGRRRAEEALKKKAQELQRFNDLMVDREIRMVELKKEINAMLVKAGEKERYVVHDMPELK